MYDDDKANQSLPDEAVLSIAGDKPASAPHANRRHFIQLHRRQPNHKGVIVCSFYPDFAGQAQRIAAALVRQTDFAGQVIRIYPAA